MRFLALLTGAALYALALPPFDLAPLAWLAVTPLLLALWDLSTRRGFVYGTLFGCACSSSVTWWAVPAIASYFHVPLWVAGLAAVAIWTVVSVPTFGVFGAAAACLLRGENARATSIVLPAMWVAMELVRGRLVGQPWGLIGYTQHTHVALIQVATLGGVYAVSYLVVLTGTVCAIVARRAALRDGPGAARATVGLLVLLLGWWTSGVVAERWTDREGLGRRSVAVVQTNVAPAFRWNRAYTQRQVGAHLDLTARIEGHPALIVWPENAVPTYLESEPMLAAELAEAASAHGADLLVGGPRLAPDGVRNSVNLFTAAGRYGGHYDKQHLVAFAEDRPFSAGAADPDSPSEFSPGRVAGVLPSFVQLGVTICHEIVYPELVHQSVRQGAELLVNVSNDGWLGGRGVASRQHFAMSVFRAVEARRYLVRGAITGVSGIVDPYGRVVQTLPSDEAGIVTAEVEGRRGLTPYVRFGDAFAAACALLSLLALARHAVGPLAWAPRPAVIPAT